MRYLKLYEQFRLILEKLDYQGKNLFLLCGPSATGKTYLAGQIGIKHWMESTDFKGNCLITTDSVDGEGEKITQRNRAIAKFKKENPYGEVKKYNIRPELPGNYKWQTIPTNHNTPFNIVPISGTGGRRVIKPAKPTKGAKTAKPTKGAKAAKTTKGVKPKKPKTIKVRKPTKTLKIKKSPLRKL